MAMKIATASPARETTMETVRMKTDRMGTVRSKTTISRTDRSRTTISRMAKGATAIPLPTKTISPMIAIMAVRMAETALVVVSAELVDAVFYG